MPGTPTERRRLNLVEAAVGEAFARRAELVDQLTRHLELAGAALAIGLVLCIPLGVWIARHRSAAEPVIALFNGFRVVPSLAILFMAVPWLGIGFRPALLALTVLACPPILLSTHAAFRNVAPAVIEAARGVGMSDADVLRRVEIPLAVPVVISGIRTASVEVIASATLASFIGAGGLGDFIVLGFQLSDPAIMLVGAVPVALLALTSEGLFSLVDHRLTPWREDGVLA